MNLTQVQYVLAVAKCGSFSRAAQDQFISQPALSRQIQNLEVELGFELFFRSQQGVILTPRGKEFCRQAEKVTDVWDVFQQSISRNTHPSIRQLRIGMGSRVYSNYLFEDIVQFFDNHSEFEVTFFAEAGQDFFNALRSGALDLALDRLPSRDEVSLEYADIATYDLISEPQCVLMALNDPRHTLACISFADLQGCTMMTGLENSIEDRMLREMCHLHKINLKRLYRSDNIDTIMNLIRAGKGITFGPLSFSSYFGVAAVPLSPKINVDLKFICLKKNAQRPDIVLFRKYITDLCCKRNTNTM